LEKVLKVLREVVNSLGRWTVTPALVEARASMVLVLRDEEAQSNFAFVQLVLLPVVEQKFQRLTLYLSARPRSAAVMLMGSLGPRAAVVRLERSLLGTGDLFRRSARFSREDEEMERFWVLISNMSRFLFVIPESMTIKMHTRLAKVRPNGTATQTNLPAPILLLIWYKRLKCGVKRMCLVMINRYCDVGYRWELSER